MFNSGWLKKRRVLRLQVRSKIEGLRDDTKIIYKGTENKIIMDFHSFPDNPTTNFFCDITDLVANFKKLDDCPDERFVRYSYPILVGPMDWNRQKTADLEVCDLDSKTMVASVPTVHYRLTIF